MARTVVAVLLVALLIAAAVHVGERREHRRAAAEWLTVRAELAAQQAALTATPADAIEYRQAIAADHRARCKASVERLDSYYLDLRGAA